MCLLKWLKQLQALVYWVWRHNLNWKVSLANSKDELHSWVPKPPEPSFWHGHFHDHCEMAVAISPRSSWADTNSSVKPLLSCPPPQLEQAAFLKKRIWGLLTFTACSYFKFVPNVTKRNLGPSFCEQKISAAVGHTGNVWIIPVFFYELNIHICVSTMRHQWCVGLGD